MDTNYSLSKDIIKSNHVGATSATTIILCNTRSWHGLLSIYDDKTESSKVILSTLDDSISSGNKTFYLSTRKYPDVFFPLGHQYILSASFNPITCIEYSIGNILLKKEMLIASNEETLLIKYTLLESVQPVRLQIRPIVAFRLANQLRRQSHDVGTQNTPVLNGVAYRPDRDEQYLYMQTSVPSDFVTAPDWNYNIEYPRDHQEGKPYQEDLFMPGTFDVELTQGKPVVFSASMRNQNPNTLDDFFKSESYTRMKRKTYEEYLQFAANQMFCEVKGEYRMIEKLPIGPQFSRDTFGALPGLTLPNGNLDMFLKIGQSYLRRLNNATFGNADDSYYEPEAPLWFIWAVQQYCYQLGNFRKFYEAFGKAVEEIVKAGMNNCIQRLSSDVNGLISSCRGSNRRFYVDVNAMWFNSLMFAANMASLNGDMELFNVINKYARRLALAFNTRFVDKSIPYLADSVDDEGNKDLSCRPRQLLAFALPYSIASNDVIAKGLAAIEEKLLTPYGLRGVSPDDPKFAQEGDITPFYLGFMAELYLKVRGEEGVKRAEEIYHVFDDKLNEVQSPNFYEAFQPEPPYEGKGSPLSAVTIATINRIKLLIDQF
ncbi:MAG: amylo-alpha-1,6-glucosidase [Bacteroidales bacterium]|nr:amylo-alpha-1,6-glucosidase [Bacteroidales bacterium]